MKESFQPDFRYSPYEGKDSLPVDAVEGWVSVIDGVYTDPNEGIVRTLNRKFKLPEVAAKEALVKAFELAEVISPTRKITKKLGEAGINGVGGPAVPQTSNDELSAPRQQKAGLVFSQTEKEHNYIYLAVDEAIGDWGDLSDEEQNEIWASSKRYIAVNKKPPEVVNILSAMAGRRPLEATGDYLVNVIPEKAFMTALAAYWRLRSNEEKQRPATHRKTG